MLTITLKHRWQPFHTILPSFLNLLFSLISLLFFSHLPEHSMIFRGGSVLHLSTRAVQCGGVEMGHQRKVPAEAVGIVSGTWFHNQSSNGITQGPENTGSGKNTASCLCTIFTLLHFHGKKTQLCIQRDSNLFNILSKSDSYSQLALKYLFWAVLKKYSYRNI